MCSRNSAMEKPGLEMEAVESAEVAARLGAEIAARYGPREEAPLSLVMRDGAGALVAGLNGLTHWRWLYIRHLWVAPARRREGLASRLIEAAERAACDRGAIGGYIDTFDPRVAAFYLRRGFSQVGEIADFPPGGQRIFLSKRLAPQGDAGEG
ncbi:MAG: GNAT family N-acetyltransferase [Hyphomicrobiales bacterium]|nr:MAG: GNAT family N-acetyltransferase [Hyphomicrobiales bacterium]